MMRPMFLPLGRSVVLPRAVVLCLIVATGCAEDESAVVDGASAPTPLGGKPLDDAYTPAIWPIGEEEAVSVDFGSDVTPIFEAHCLECHEGEEPAGGLSLTSVAGILAGGQIAGPAVVPGTPDDSPLVLHVRGILRPKMPKGGDELSQENLHTIRVWIAAGAKDAGNDG